MKKIISLSTGILFLATILIAVGCNCKADSQNNNGNKEVTIHIA